MRNPTILSLFPLISLFPALTYCVPPRLLSLVYEGTGCPDNSISSTVTPVNFSSPNPTSSLTLLYTALTPSISPSVPTTETRTHCTVEIGLGWGDETPSGSSGNWEFSVLHTAVLGQNDPIDRGVGIHFSFLYDISGAGNMTQTLNFAGPSPMVDSELSYQMESSVVPEPAPYSGCGGVGSLGIEGRVRKTRMGGTPSGTFPVEREVTVMQTVVMGWRRCEGS